LIVGKGAVVVSWIGVDTNGALDGDMKFGRFMKRLHSTTLCWGLLVVVCWVAQATQPPPPGSLAAYQRDGTYARRQAFVQRLGNHLVRPDVARRTAARLQTLVADHGVLGPLPAWEGMPTKGTNRILVLLIEFPDYPHVNNKAAIEHKLGGTGDPEDYPLESLRRYYLRSSYGQLDLVPTVLDWYRVNHDRGWYTRTYGESSAANRAIIEEALGHWEATQDFALYDNDGDGEVDYLAVLWAGPDNGWGNFWWGYKSTLSERILADNVWFRTYTWQWESNPVGQEFNPAVLMHETGHVLGLPDYYDYDNTVGPRGGVGGLDMMDENRGDHNAFSKFMLEWITPLAIGGGQSNVTLRALAGAPEALALMPGYLGATPYAEYFLVENRHRVQNDSRNPGDGLLLWHVDAQTDASGQTFRYNNSYTEYKLLRLMEADGLEEIESGWDANAGDYYVQGSLFSPLTYPNSRAYSGANTDIVIDQIPAPDPVMTFHAGMAPTPPSILVQPQSRQVLAGSTVSFRTVVAGSDPLIMQWWKDGFAVPEATGPVLTLNRVSVADAGVYSLHLTNGLGTAVSAGATLTILGSLTLADALEADLGWRTGPGPPWLPQTEIAWDRVDAASSGVIPDGSESWLETEASGPLELTFWWKVSSEASADFLEFYLDGQLQPGRISGETDWSQLVFHLPSGLHTLRWRYVKDGVGSGGSDAG